MNYDVDIFAMPQKSNEEIFRIRSGIYFVFTSDWKQLLYIGQSRHIWRRLRQHENNIGDVGMVCNDELLINPQFKVLEIEPKELNKVERYFIEKYKPPMNSSFNSNNSYATYHQFLFDRINEYERSRYEKRA